MTARSAQLHPLDVNPSSGEVFLRLSSPHENIIITPPRLSDVDVIPALMNDPRVHQTLEGPPYPYLPEHAELWIKAVKSGCDAVLAQLEHAAETGQMGPIIVDGCPVRILREVREDGTDIFLGDIAIDRNGKFDTSGDTEAEKELELANMARPVGDDEIVWSFGDYLSPSHHGKGIMTAAIKAILYQWAVPRMNAKKAIGTVFKGNIGSIRVFEKNGFVMRGTVKNWGNIPEGRGGGKVDLHFMEWNFESASHAT
ncbi:acyl-CoA N-acyltransferase [Rickenella mellea]|uniref:Acyl-CoA N-acyltransferase n=1 Tax=Rickenella mellea TaxID=50990 RepID=A0A4Y7QE87_9AGAM|nr:acyl-CoA N-acyltransferase [Rickenella mellea]